MALIENVVLVPAVEASQRRVFQFIMDTDDQYLVANWMYQDAQGNDLNKTKTVKKDGADFARLAQSLTLDGETIYEAMRRIIYAEMAD